MLTSYLIAASVWLVFLVLGAIFLRVFQPLERVRALRMIFLGCTPLVFVFADPLRSVGIDGVLPLRLQYSLVTAAEFAAIAYVYLQVYSAIDASITIRILVHFFEAGEKPLSRTEIEALYPFDELLNRKMDYMVRDGLVSGGETLRLTARGRFVGRALDGVKRFLKLGDGG